MQPNSDFPILIVEDDQGIRDSLHELLVAEGYEVLLAENGQAAIDILSSCAKPPSLILLDLSMPVMDGKTFLEELAKLQPPLRQTAVFIMTAAGTQSMLAPGEFYKLIRKPLDVDILMEAIEDL